MYNVFMASGYANHLTKQVGEFLVCAELGRRGLVATTFAGSMPGFDVVATNAQHCSILLQVKTARSASNSASCWPLTGKFLDIATDSKTGRQTVKRKALGDEAKLIYVFVLLRGKRCESDRFFVCRAREAQDACLASYTEFLSKHGYVRPKKPQSTDLRIRPSDLSKFENSWELINLSLSGS